MTPVDIVLEVIRGERPLADLEEAGVALSFHPTGPEGKAREVRITQTDPFEVFPTLADIAKGLLARKDMPVDLRDWATFMIVADWVSIDELEVDPRFEELWDGVWSASFEARTTPEVVALAGEIVGQAGLTGGQ